MKSFIIKIALLAVAVVYAQDLTKQVNDVDVFRPEKRNTRVELVDSTKSNSVTLNVDVFADWNVGSYYILWDQIDDISEEMKKILTTRDFARDEFFMQNIDREQFEQERLLQLFEDKKREYFAIFPEEALKMLEDEKRDALTEEEKAKADSTKKAIPLVP